MGFFRCAIKLPCSFDFCNKNQTLTTDFLEPVEITRFRDIGKMTG